MINSPIRGEQPEVSELVEHVKLAAVATKGAVDFMSLGFVGSPWKAGESWTFNARDVAVLSEEIDRLRSGVVRLADADVATRRLVSEWVETASGDTTHARYEPESNVLLTAAKLYTTAEFWLRLAEHVVGQMSLPR